MSGPTMYNPEGAGSGVGTIIVGGMPPIVVHAPQVTVPIFGCKSALRGVLTGTLIVGPG